MIAKNQINISDERFVVRQKSSGQARKLGCRLFTLTQKAHKQTHNQLITRYVALFSLHLDKKKINQHTPAQASLAEPRVYSYANAVSSAVQRAYPFKQDVHLCPSTAGAFIST